MRGVALRVSSSGGKSTRILDDRYKASRPDHRVWGYNGLEIGAWFLYQISMNARGAHGASQAGISGNSQHGAYSIVVSGHYEEDTDLGDQLEYCGPWSSDSNRDPDKDASGTKCLKASVRTGKPVRVMRTSRANSAFSPREGIRYDGLYRVVSSRLGLNKASGKIDIFTLVREKDQDSMDRSRPTSSELA